MKTIRFAVVSDLHFCKSGSGKDHSWLACDQQGKIKSTIWADLKQLIEKESLTVDALICPGDITTKACKDSLALAWNHLNELNKLLESKLLAAAVGNHDVQSRESAPTSPDPYVAIECYTDLNEGVKLLEPPFPIVVVEELNNQMAHNRRVHYFGADFAIYDEDPFYRVVTINSCSRHTSSPKEHGRGSVSEAMLNWLSDKLDELNVKSKHKINILVCHHHPIKHSDHNLGAYDEMFAGEKLISLLKRHGYWMIVHGHKHHAKLTYCQSGLKRVPVFAAGTMAAHKDDSLGEGLVNQFYILNFQRISKNTDIKVSIEAWTWSPVSRWTKSLNRKDGIYSGVGIGATTSMPELVNQVASYVPTVGKHIDWGKVKELVEDLNYCTPEDIDHLVSELKDQGIVIEPNTYGEFWRLSRESSS